jgi:gamma-glutamyl-gamma-aminobutyraldehyde dehydrogenase
MTATLPDTATRPSTLADWQAAAAALTIDGRPVIDGRRVDARSGQTHAKTNPATGEVISQLHLADASDVDAAVASARAAFDAGAWSRASAIHRREVLLHLADLIEARSDEFALLDTLDMGKPIGESSTIDAPGAAALFRFYGEAIEKLSDEIPVTPAGSTALVTREPLGVIGVIVPWNYPLEIATWKIAPALAAGNALVVKPPVEASHSVLLLAEIAVEAGCPPASSTSSRSRLGRRGGTGSAHGRRHARLHRLHRGRQAAAGLRRGVEYEASGPRGRRQERERHLRRHR